MSTQPERPTDSAGPRQGILLRSRHFVLDWTLSFTHTTVTLDGDKFERPWGDHVFQLEPGRHQLQVCYRCLWLRCAGQASIVVDVAADQIVQVTYQAPLSVLVAFLHGKLTIHKRSTS